MTDGAMDTPQPLKREIQNGELTIEGEKYPLVQDGIHTVWMRVDDISYIEGYSWYEDKGTFNRRVTGKATIERSDTLKVAGWEEKTTKLTFSLKPAPEGQDQFNRRVILGFNPSDWEFSSSASWWCEAYLAAEQFDRLTNEMYVGRAKSLMMFVKGEWWIRSHDRHTPASMGITLFLLPDERYANTVSPMRGEIENISWGLERAMRDAEAEEIPADATDMPPLPEDAVAREIGLLRRSLTDIQKKLTSWLYVLLGALVAIAIKQVF